MDEQSATGRTLSRDEKKARKMLHGIEVERVYGIRRVVCTRPRNELIVIAEPEVYRAVVSGAYFVYGEPTVQANTAKPQVTKAEEMARRHMQRLNLSEKDMRRPLSDFMDGKLNLDPAAKKAAEPVASEAKHDEKDIELVMKQANVSRQEAILALENTKGDVITAIMDLTE